jgi:F0F1-type ATP synthase assembly protein I
MIARDAATQRIAARILLTQAGTTIAVAVLCGLAWGRIAALSALAGGATGLFANAIMTLIVLRAAHGAAGALGRLVMGQMVKVVFTVAVLLIVARGGWVHWPSLLAAYAATLFVYWFVPVLMHRSRRVKD